MCRLLFARSDLGRWNKSENGQVSLDSCNICWRDLKVVVNIQMNEFVKVLQISFARYLMAQTVKNLTAVSEVWVQSLDWEVPLEEGMATHSGIPCLENPHGQRSLMGYSPWGHKESDTTERLSTQHIWIQSISLWLVRKKNHKRYVVTRCPYESIWASI